MSNWVTSRHRWRSTPRARACLLLTFAFLSTPGNLTGWQEDVTVWVAEGPSDHRIELHIDVEVRSGDEEHGGVSYPYYVAEDSQGRLFLTSSFGPARVQVFGADGHWITSFGRAGGGPGEFTRIGLVLAGLGDTLHVFDGGAGTYSVVSPGFEIVRRSLIGTDVRRATITRNGRVVVNADIRTPDRFGFPLHLLESVRIGPTIGWAEAIEGRVRPEPFGINRALASAGADEFYAAHSANYVVDLWSVSGEHRKRILHAPAWFSKEDRTTVRGRYNSLIESIHIDEDGRIWVLASAASERFDEWAVQTGAMPGVDGELPIVGSRTGSVEDLQDSILEVIDPKGMRVLATLRVSQRLSGFLTSGRIYGYEEDEQDGRVIIWKATLVAG